MTHSVSEKQTEVDVDTYNKENPGHFIVDAGTNDGAGTASAECSVAVFASVALCF